MSLKVQMEAVVKMATDLAAQSSLPHWEICAKVSERFYLFNDQSMFPVWLSRLVEDCIVDVRAERAVGLAESTNHLYNEEQRKTGSSHLLGGETRIVMVNPKPFGRQGEWKDGAL